MEDVARILTFILEIDRLKAVLRKTRPLAIDRAENSAEHSWQVALLAMLLASHVREPIDIARVIEILLVHDIPEIEVGDVIVYAAAGPERKQQEEQAARDLFGILPEPQSARCLALWLEYEERHTAEARFAYAVDRLMPILHNLQRSGGTWREFGISQDQVLSANAITGEVLPDVWNDVRAQVVACFDHMAAGTAPSD